MKRYLVCTDLDRTLIPNGTQSLSPLAHERFLKLADRDDVTLAYVTGRHLSLIEQAIAEYDLPRADYAIADVGSAIYQFEKGQWIQLREWSEYIGAEWKDWTRDEIFHLLSVFPALKMQENEKQSRHKISFTTEIDEDLLLKDELDAFLMQTGVMARTVWSRDELANTGLLDVLPQRAGKLNALHFLVRKLGMELENTVFSGDSGNDLDVLLSDIPAVLVANAEKNIKLKAANAPGHAIYIAQGNYLGMNGNYAGGILEGIAHYWPEIDTWLRELR